MVRVKAAAAKARALSCVHSASQCTSLVMMLWARYMSELPSSWVPTCHEAVGELVVPSGPTPPYTCVVGGYAGMFPDELCDGGLGHGCAPCECWW